jgi:hypothetical protein
MNRISTIAAVAALTGLSLAGCATVEKYAGVAVTAAPVVASDVQLGTALTSNLLSQIAAANPNDSKVQKIVAKANNGLVITKADVNTLSAYAPVLAGSVKAGAIAGQAVATSVK